MIELYEHNQKAYDAVVSMLAKTGKAAVVHPTGTGKSFIAFKLCEDEPDKTVCWLSPSEYIFKTQLENLKRSSGYEPKNIKFFTYAKLMIMSEPELAAIQPDIIVYDEFHRAGAAQWSRGIERLRKMYPVAPMLGLSATAVRYLDNNRDLAEELFDSYAASEMSLGEAIVRGILPAPKYVTTVFKYQQDLERWQKRVDSARAFGIRDEAQKYLDALRRALEQADGLDVIFQKHITNKSGKYIVFCANVEHMREIPISVKKVNYDVSSVVFYHSYFWCALPDFIVEYIVSFLKENPTCWEIYDHALVPEEGFFSTIIMNSKYNNCIDYINGKSFSLTYRGPSENGHPPLITMKDIDNIMGSEKFFARKFDIEKDKDVIDFFVKHTEHINVRGK